MKTTQLFTSLALLSGWLILIALGVTMPLPAVASTYHVWDGSSSAFWNNPNNWTDNQAPASGDVLVFPPLTGIVRRYVTTNNYTAGTQFAMVFLGSNYVLRGHQINLLANSDPGIVLTNQSGTNTVELELVLPTRVVKPLRCERVSGTLILSGIISGSGGLAKDGPGTLGLWGLAPNTYTGPTRVLGGMLLLRKARGGAVRSLSVGSGTVARLMDDEQIGGAVTVDAAGLLDLNNQTDSITSLTLNAGKVETGSGLLTLQGNLTAASSASAVPNIEGQLALTADPHTFDVPDGPAFPDLHLYATVSGAGGFTKIGTGALNLPTANSFAGPVVVDGGLLIVSNSLALGATSAGTTVNVGGVLLCTNTSVSGERLTLAAGELVSDSYVNNNWTADLVLEGNAVISVFRPGPKFTLNGALTGTGTLTKRGVGTLVTSGPDVNSYLGKTKVEAGTLELNKATGFALNGPLIIGNTNGSFASVSIRAPLQIPQAVPITNYYGGTLAFNGYSHAIGPLVLIGGTVTIGSGTLTLSADTIVHAVSGRTSRIDGYGGTVLLNETRTFNIIGRFLQEANPERTPPDLRISASIAGSGGIIKSGSGMLSLDAANTFAGEVQILAGSLGVGNNALGGPEAGTTVRGGTLVVSGSILNEALHILGNAPGTGFDGPLVATGSGEWSGPILLDADVDIISYHINGSLTLSGPISGNGGFSKWGYGTLVLAGNTANTYAGSTSVRLGKLSLAKTIPNAAVPHNLTVNYVNWWYTYNPVPAVLEVLNSEQIADTAEVSIHDNPGGGVPNGQGYLMLANSSTERIAFLGGEGDVRLENGTLTVAGDGAREVTHSGVISGAGRLIKSGTSTLTLSGQNTYTDETLVQGGSLLVNGGLQSRIVRVSPGATLGGVGTVRDIEMLGGTLAPGTGPGRLTANNVTFTNASTFRVELNGLAPALYGVGYDQLRILGAANLGDATLDLSIGFAPTEGDSFVIITNETSTTFEGTFSNFPNNGSELIVSGVQLRINYEGGTGNDVVLTVVSKLPPTYTVSAGPPQVVGYGEEVHLHGTVNNPGGSPLGTLSYRWTQIPGPGRSTFARNVAMTGENSPDLVCWAPYQDITLWFRLTVSDVIGHELSDDVRVTVVGSSAEAIYVSAAYGNDGNSGTSDAPVSTLGQAMFLANAVSNSPSSVFVVVEAGQYSLTDTLTLTKPIRLYGGFRSDGTSWWTRDAVEPTRVTGPATTIAIDAPPPEASSDESTDSIIIDGFEIQSANGVGGDITQSNGESSICIHVKRGNLVATQNILKPGTGGSGAQGRGGSRGRPGTPGADAEKGTHSGPFGTRGAGSGVMGCAPWNGGRGGIGGGRDLLPVLLTIQEEESPEVATDLLALLLFANGCALLNGLEGEHGAGQDHGGPGGASGSCTVDFEECGPAYHYSVTMIGLDGQEMLPAYWPNRAQDGPPGLGGKPGRPGSPGTRGGHGNGGSGGGGGGSSYLTYLQDVNLLLTGLSWCNGYNIVAIGGPGGGGGGGGEGGEGGQSGFAGGASIGILVNNRCRWNIAGNTFYLNGGGRGGDGGTNGPGGIGQVGGNGAPLSPFHGYSISESADEMLDELHSIGRGGHGQRGQSGGNGGHGGGGGGGNSLGVYLDMHTLLNQAEIDSNNYIVHGTGGTGGQGEGAEGNGLPGVQKPWDIRGAPAAPPLETLERVRDLPKYESAVERLQVGDDLSVLSLRVEWQGDAVLTTITTPSGRAITPDLISQAPGMAQYEIRVFEHEEYGNPSGEWTLSFTRPGTAAGPLGPSNLSLNSDHATAVGPAMAPPSNAVYITIGTLRNRKPVALVRDVTVVAGLDGRADASIDAGSYDPDVGDFIQVRQIPESPYPVGATVVTLEVQDRFGFVSTGQATVTVRDETPPTVDVPELIVVQADANREASVTIPVSAVDNADPNPTIQVDGLPVYPVGITEVVVRVTDASGNVAQSVVQVAVVDETRQATSEGSGYSFDQGTLEPFVPQGGTWVVQNGRLAQLNPWGLALARLDIGRFQEYTISFEFTQMQGDYTTFCYAHSDRGANYRVDFGTDYCRLTLPRWGQTWQTRAFTVQELDLPLGKPHRAMVVVGSKGVRVYLDGALMHDQAWWGGVPLGDGMLALGTFNALAEFDNVMVSWTWSSTYRPPPGGWAYLYTGDKADGAPRRQNQPALDGTWRHENGSDEWNGDARGSSASPAGGVEARNGILTIEDAVTATAETNNNRKVYFTHDLRQEGITSTNLLDSGVTLSFRARLTAPDAKSEIPMPNGYGIFSSGKGMVGLHQSGSSSIISFSLVQAQEDGQAGTDLQFRSAGLTMNRLNGDMPNGDFPVSQGVNSSTVPALNPIVPLDPTVFHEFWITIQTNDLTPGNGTHRVKIYVDGGRYPYVFDVTAGTGDDTDTTVSPAWTDYLALGLNNSPTVGAFDVDFLAYKAGVFEPVGAQAANMVGRPGVDWNTNLMAYVTPTGADGYDMVGTGADIGGTSDGFLYVHERRTGDFDARVAVTWLDPSDYGAKAGLMVRESLDPGSRHCSLFVTPAAGRNGCIMEMRAAPGGGSGEVAYGSGVAYPDGWLRLRRVGNRISALRSTDGATWQLVGQVEMSFGDPVCLGLATTSHNFTNTTTATYRNYEVNWPLKPIVSLSPAQSALVEGTSAANLRLELLEPASAPLTVSLAANRRAGAALSFDGVDDSVMVAHAAALNSFPLTLSAWINTTNREANRYGGIVNKYVSGSANGYNLYLFQGHVRAWYFKGGNNYVWDGGNGLDGGDVADGTWHHVAFTVDTRGGKLYVDGMLQDTRSWTGTPGPPDTTIPLNLGLYPGQPAWAFGHFQGLVDEARVWSVARTAVQIRANMQRELTGEDPDLVAYWPCEEDASMTLTDATGHGFTGTPVGGTAWADAAFAESGTDYERVPESFTIPAGSTVAPISIRALDDVMVERPEIVPLTLLSSSDYEVLHPVAAQVILLDDDAPSGGLWREVYLGVPWGTIDHLRASPKFPAAPDVKDWVPALESGFLPGNLDDEYGQRLWGWLVPPENGDYTFYLASDDGAEFYLSTDETPAHKQLIVQEPAWNGWRNWEGQHAADPVLNPHTGEPFPQRASAPIPLSAGRYYYVELLHKEARGGDRVAVAWKKPSDPAPPANGSELIGGTNLACWLPLSVVPPVQVVNPSFEMDSFTVDPGYTIDNGPITGWTALAGMGLNPVWPWGGALFANNGTIPDGQQVAFLQQSGALSQVLHGLVVGVLYEVRYAENASLGSVAPMLEVMVGGKSIVPRHAVMPVQGANPYWRMTSWAFVATAPDLELAFIKSDQAGEQSAVMIDDVQVVPPLSRVVGQFTADFNGGQLRGMRLFSDAQVGDGYLKLTVNSNDQYGAAYIEDINAGAPVHGFTATFQAALFGSTCCTHADGSPWPADGFSFNLLPRSALPEVPSHGFAAEEGSSIGLSVCFDTWDNSLDPPEAPAIEVKWNGGLVGRTFFQPSQSALRISTAEEARREVVINLDATGHIDVSYGGSNVFSRLQIPGFSPVADAAFMLGARTGGANDNQWIDDLKIRVTGAPIITGQPLGADVFIGEIARFTVEVVGSPPFTYQWKKGHADVPGGTNATLLLTNVMAGDADSYRVIVRNAAGSETSSEAVLTVRPVADIFTALLAYWPLDTLTGVTPDVSGNANDLTATNLPAAALQPGHRGQALAFNGTNSMLVHSDETGTGLPAYGHPSYSVALWVKGSYVNQWDRRVFSESANTNNSPLFTIGTHNQASNGVVDIFIRNNDGSASLNHCRSSLIAFDDVWHHIVWVDDKGFARLYVDGLQDANSFLYERGVLTPHLTTVGGILRSNGPSHWFNGLIDEVAVWGRALTKAEVQSVFANGLVVQAPVAIVTSPQSQEVCPGSTVIFQVEARGEPPLSYQWRHQGANLPGATGSELVLPAVQSAQTGGYSVVVSNQSGAATSAVATLTISGARVLIPLANAWRYNQNGEDLGTTWKEVSYDDSAWPAGAALFGVETSQPYPYPEPISTPLNLIPPGGSNQVITYYFRTHFSFAGNTEGLLLVASNYLDDGAVFYLNGQEVGWVRMPSGPVSYQTLATSTSREGSVDVVSLPTHLLVQGDNVLAVELHQQGVSSSDIVFGLWLTSACAESPVLLGWPVSQRVPVGHMVALTVSASGTLPLSYQWQFSGTNLTGATNLTLTLTNVQYHHAGNYSVVVTNAYGSVRSHGAVLNVQDPAQQFTVLPLAQEWKYNQSGIDLGNAWIAVDYDDSSWPAGPALLGVETSVPYPYPEPIRTPFSLQDSNGIPVITYYLRTRFLFVGEPEGVWLTASSYVDDGAVFYLNGFEVARVRMPAGTVSNSTLATRTVALEGGLDTIYFPPNLLREGDNMVAVEVHQATTGSSDIVFGTWLTAMRLPTNTVEVPADVGTTVTGFQDNFDDTTLDPNWVVRGEDVFSVSGGMLHVSSATGDPNHLLYEAAGYNNSVQEVLARIRVTSFGWGDPSRAGIATVVDSASSQGINLHFRDEPEPGQRHMELLDDIRKWGPESALGWQANTWYWLRLRHDPNAAALGGVNDAFGKTWLADGSQAEPAAWQNTWDYLPARSARTGFAGVVAGSLDGLSEFDVDYILIKASGLPNIVVVPNTILLVPPAITRQPQTQTVVEGGTVTFTVGASGTPPLCYQWQCNSTSLADATNLTLTLTEIQAHHAGHYSVVVSNLSGSVTSQVAVLTVQEAWRQFTVLPLAQEWRCNQNGTDLGTVWSEVGYDDSAWPSGPALLGVETSYPYPYLDAISTPLSLRTPGASSQVITYYFRTHFAFAGNPDGVSLAASNYLDDAAVFYLNGMEAGRVRMPPGPVSYDTQAASLGTEGVVDVVHFPANLLALGDNVLAVEVHQWSATSSDVVFGMILHASVTNENCALRFSSVRAGGAFQMEVRGPYNATYVIQASSDLTHWVPIATNAAPQGVLSYRDESAPGFHQRFYRARLAP